jgi:hypothetical protein
MTIPAPFIDVTGFPAPGEGVAPTPRAATHLIAAGWTPPASGAPSTPSRQTTSLPSSACSSQ